MKVLTLPRLVTLLAFLGIFAIALRTPADTDMYWHLATGQYIAETHTIPMSDPFSWTMHGMPWVDVHWLSQVIMYVVYWLSGFAGLALGVALLAVVAFAFVWKQMSGGVFIRAAIILLAATAASPNLTPRSQMATFVLVAALGYLLFLYKWRQVDRLWVVPLIFVLWVNMHGGYIAGFMLVGAFIAGEAIGNLLHLSGDEIVSWRRLGKVLIITFISGAVLLINPYTIAALQLPFKTVNIGVLQDFIQEWASPNFHQVSLQPMLWMLLLTLVAIGFSRRRLDLTDALTLTLFATITFLAQRNLGLFALICAPILSRHVSAIAKRSHWGQRSLSKGKPIVNAALLGLIIAAVALYTIVILSPTAQSKAEAKSLPAAAANWIAQNRPNGPLFNSYNWGGYLLWRLGDEYPVYVDGRTDVYDDAFLRNFLAITLVGSDYDRRLTNTGAAILLIESGSVLDNFLARNTQWHEVYRDEIAVVYQRVEG
jgi:hypothetical protein